MKNAQLIRNEAEKGEKADGTKRKQKARWLIDLNLIISIITLNVNGLNTPNWEWDELGD